MQIVTLKVQVDNVQLTKLQADVESLQGKTIKINAGEATDSIKRYSDTVKDAARGTETLFEKVGKFTQWYYIAGAVTSATNAMRDALETMKSVDSELVTIQKVTGATGERIDALTQKAYDLSAAYGRTADQLLSMSATFARAGFGDQIEQMTELGALLQNVGDLNEDTAAKFLVAANAAWKLNGNYDSLMSIIDGMNEVTNTAAVDMEALTTGITVAGSVFANAGESAQTYTALVGTGVAATQRSGAEIARGLRTIAMRIRQVKGELEDGEIVDEASISKAAKALNSVGVAAADQYGELRKVSDVLTDLAGKWDTLTSGEQSYLAESLAGQRQANVLVALMRNFDEYQRQMAAYANSAGSALQENGIYLDSWEAKVNILSSTWTRFVSHMVETDAIKGGLDIVTDAINLLDSSFGRLALAVGIASGAVKVFSVGLEAVKGTEFVMLLQGIVAGGADAAAAISLISEALLASPVAWAAAIAAALMGLKSIDDATSTSYAEAKEHLEDVTKELNEKQRILDELDAKGIDNLTDAEKGLKLATEETVKLLKEQQKQAAETEWHAFVGEKVHTGNAMFGEGAGGGLGIGNSIGRFDYMEGLLTQMENGVEISTEASMSMAEFAQKLYEAKLAGVALSEEFENWGERYGIVQDSQLGAKEATEEATEASENAGEKLGANIEHMKELNEQIDGVQNALNVLSEAQDEYNQTGTLSVDTLQQLLSLGGEYLTAIFDETGAINLNSDAVNDLINDKTGLLRALAAESIASYAAAEADRLLAEQEGSAGETAQNASSYLHAAADAAIRVGQDAANAAAGVDRLTDALARLAKEKGLTAANAETLRKNTENYATWVTDQIMKSAGNIGGWTGGGSSRSSGGGRSSGGSGRSGSGGGSGSRSQKNPEKEKLEAEKKQLQKEKKELQKQRDAALAKNDVEKKKAEAQRDKEVEAVEQQIKELKKQHEQQEKANKLAELQLEIDKAQLALENVQKERTVRYYNASTKQWEWIYNDTDRIKAEQTLENARKKKADEEAKQAYDDQLAALKDQKDKIKQFWDDTLDALKKQREGMQDYWKNAINRLDDTIDTLQEKLSNLKTNVTVNVSGGGGGGSTVYTSGGGGGGGGGSSSSGGGGSSLRSGNDVKALQNFLRNYRNADIVADGVYGSATKNAVRALQKTIGVQQTGNYTDVTRQALAAWLKRNRVNAPAPPAIFDSGGILHGLGGIKATREDEMILPPAQTQDVLEPSRDSAYQKALDRIGAVFSRSGEATLPQEISQKLLSPMDNTIFDQSLFRHGYMYGTTHAISPNTGATWTRNTRQEVNYNFGGLSITPQQADSMTVSQFVNFVKSSHNLGLHAWGK